MSPRALPTAEATAASASATRIGPAAALTTPFVPPQKCLDESTRFANPACMPPDWDAYYYGNVGYYSPAVCPQSYAVAAQRPAGFGPDLLKGETAVLCCPSGYITDSVSASYCRNAASSSGYAVQVRWQSSDMASLQGITQMIAEVTALPGNGYSTLSATSAPTSKSSSSSGLSTGATVAVGIFIPLLIISLIAGAAIFFLRRRQRRLHADAPTANIDKSAFHSYNSSSASDTLRVASYITASQASLSEENLKGGKGSGSSAYAPEVVALQILTPPTPANRQSHISLASASDRLAATVQAELENSARVQAASQSHLHKPQISLEIPPQVHLSEVDSHPQQHGDTPLLPRAPSPSRYHPPVDLNRSMSPPLQNYGYSNLQRLSREDMSALPPFVAPLPPPTVDRPEPLRIRQSLAGQPDTRAMRRVSSTPSLAPVSEVVTEDRYMAPPSTAIGDRESRPDSNLFPEDLNVNGLIAATFPLSPGTTETSYSDATPMQMPVAIQELEAHVKPLSIKSAKSTKSTKKSPKQAPSSPPRSKSAMASPLKLDVENHELPKRSRSALDQSPTIRHSSHSDEIPFRPTTPQALPRVFSSKRTMTAVNPKMNIESLPKLTVPDYAGADYGEDTGSAVDVQDEEMFRRVRERRMLEERERRLEQEVDSRYSWRGNPRRHRPRSMSIG